MIVILGLVILVAGVAGVLANGGHARTVTHFAVFGYPVTGSPRSLPPPPRLEGFLQGGGAASGLGVGAPPPGLRGRGGNVCPRPAGWGALVDATLPSGRAGQRVPAVTDEIQLDPSYDQVAAVRAKG